MRVKSSTGHYRYVKNSFNSVLLDMECLRQARLLSGHHPDTGEKMTPEQARQWNAAIRAGQ